MTIWHIMLKEISHRKANFVGGVVSVMVAIACLTGAMTLLKAHDMQTLAILSAKQQETEKRMASLQDEMRKSMLKLGFNILILSKDQSLGDWHAQEYASKFMPEEYAARLAGSGLITIRHLTPILQQKVTWPEKGRKVIVVGTRGEVGETGPESMAPLAKPVAKGGIVLGYELHREFGLKGGDKVAFMGKELTVAACEKERGTEEDITAWMDLGEAQGLLSREGLINAIMAVECQCSQGDLGSVRAEIVKLLPDTQVIERNSNALARAEARLAVEREAKTALAREKQARDDLRDRRERQAAILVPLVMAASIVWVAGLALANVRRRAPEIAVLAAMGVRSRQILLIFLSRALLAGLVGAAGGLVIGLAVGRQLGNTLEGAGRLLGLGGLLDWKLVLVSLALGPLLSVLASWIPAEFATRQDPALVLRKG